MQILKQGVLVCYLGLYLLIEEMNQLKNIVT